MTAGRINQVSCAPPSPLPKWLSSTPHKHSNKQADHAFGWMMTLHKPLANMATTLSIRSVHAAQVQAANTVMHTLCMTTKLTSTLHIIHVMTARCTKPETRMLHQHIYYYCIYALVTPCQQTVQDTMHDVHISHPMYQEPRWSRPTNNPAPTWSHIRELLVQNGNTSSCFCESKSAQQVWYI